MNEKTLADVALEWYKDSFKSRQGPWQTSKGFAEEVNTSTKDIGNPKTTNTGSKVAHHEPEYPEGPMLLAQSSS